MLDSSEKRRRITKWLLSLFTCCILIYLGFRHISSIAAVILQLLDLAKPLLIDVMLALIFNVPMSFFERYLRTKAGLQHAARPLSIGLSLLLVFGIFIGVTVLVVPEVVKAIKLIVQITGGGLEQLAQMENNTALTSTPLGQLFEKVDIDWLGLKSQMEEWVKSRSGTLVNQVVGAAGSLAGGVITFSIGLIFAVYILAGKERLKHQASRVLHVWLPKRFVEELIHVAAVCSNTFRLFITGQATEAIILGTLCMVGMLILRIPYAPMIGALVGVTALIPIVGAIMIMTVNPFKAFVFVVFLLILQQIEGNMIYPKVVGSQINLPAIWVLAAVTIGGNLGGPIGMLLGVSAASAAYALLKESHRPAGAGAFVIFAFHCYPHSDGRAGKSRSAIFLCSNSVWLTAKSMSLPSWKF